VIHISGNPAVPGDVREAAEYTSSMYEAWDMLTGRAQPELGGKEKYLDVIGVNYYDRNQWWNHGEPIRRDEPEYRPFSEIVGEVYRRYERPMFVSETGTEDEDRPAWLAYIAGQVEAAVRAGADIQGICVYPILNHPGWEDDRHCYNGLWDYPTPTGDRDIFEPLAEEMERQRNRERGSYESTKTTRRALHLTPALEFRIPTAAALDEPLCRGTASLLYGGAAI